MARRRLDDPFGQATDEIDQSLLGGEQDIPYDQTAAPEDPALPPVEAPMGEMDPGAMAEGDPAQDPMLAGLGGLAPDPTSDGMSDVDLAGLGADQGLEGLASPEDDQVAQLEAAMTDPNTSPEERQLIEQQIALAARRRMSGMGQDQAAGY